MPDLSNKGAHEFWHSYHDPLIYRVVSFMEGVEDWSLDGDPALEEAMERLGRVLDDLGNVDIKKEDELIKIAAYIKSARSLRLLQCLDSAHPGAASKLLSYAEENSFSAEDVPGLFLRRNIVFERLRLLSRVFSPERFAKVLKALETANYD